MIREHKSKYWIDFTANQTHISKVMKSIPVLCLGLFCSFLCDRTIKSRAAVWVLQLLVLTFPSVSFYKTCRFFFFSIILSSINPNMLFVRKRLLRDRYDGIILLSTITAKS